MKVSYRGGLSKSARKMEAIRKNLVKAREACAAKRKVGQGLPWSRSPKPE